MNQMEKHSTFNIQRPTSKGSARARCVECWELNVECSMLTGLAGSGCQSPVAQISNLPYRRFSICGADEIPDRFETPEALPNAIRRYSRLQICATS
jgi:hypothetical protein